MTAVIVVALVADYVVLSNRLAEFSIVAPAAANLAANQRTWVIVGSDSRSALADGTTAEGFGSAADVPGERADVIVVIRQTDAGLVTFTVPRDLALQVNPFVRTRAALAIEQGYQGLADGLCNSLGIPVTDMVVIDFATFAAAVDAVGGIELTVPTPIRDQTTGLAIDTAGAQHLDGVQALALVRSRDAQIEQNGTWIAEPDGAQRRAERSVAALQAFATAASGAVGNPLTAQRLAWVLTGGLRASQDVGLLDLLELRSVTDPTVLPTDAAATSTVLTRTLSDQGRNALKDWGFGGECRSASMAGYELGADGLVRATGG